MKKIQKLKAELKLTHATIKRVRPLFKQMQRDQKMDYEVLRPYWQAMGFVREAHIAYCLLRGTSYQAIEPKVREGNEPNWTAINRIVEAYREQPEVVCGDAIGSV